MLPHGIVAQGGDGLPSAPSQCHSHDRQGAGKTTALMAVASCLVARGERVALFEADENAPLARWRQNAMTNETWSEQVLLLPAASERDLERSYERADSEGCAYALADTAGGGSELNTIAMTNAESIVIPTGLSVIDLDEALSTLAFASDLFTQLNQPSPARMLFTRWPQGKLKAAEEANISTIDGLPVFDAKLTERAAFADLKATGLLHAYRGHLAATPSRRLLARHIELAIAEAEALTDEILTTLPA